MNVICHILVKIIPRILQVENLERLTNDVRKKDFPVLAELVEEMTWQLVRVSDEVLVPIIMVWNGMRLLSLFLQTWRALSDETSITLQIHFDHPTSHATDQTI